MRVYLLGLVLANLMLFFWQYRAHYERPSGVPGSQAEDYPRLRLQSELPPEEFKSEPEKAPIIPHQNVSRKEVEDKERCFVLGPVSGQTNAVEVEKVLVELPRAVFNRYRIDDDNRPEFLVLIPSLPENEVRSVAKRLRDDGVTDLFVGARNFISLGMFASEEAARRRQREISALGYQSTIEDKSRNIPRFEFSMTLSGPTQRLDRQVVQIEQNLPEYLLRPGPCIRIARQDAIF